MRARLTAVMTICVFAVAGTALAQSGDEESPAEGIERVAAIEPAAAEALGVLDRARTATDDMPPHLAGPLGERAPFGMNPDLSRLAIGQTTNSVYVVPAREHVCLAVEVGEGATLTCPSTEAIAGGNAAPAAGMVNGGEGIAVVGLVPDGIDTVTLRTSDGSAAVEVINNTYYTVVGDETTLDDLSYYGPEGPVSWPLPSPGSADQ